MVYAHITSSATAMTTAAPGGPFGFTPVTALTTSQLVAQDVLPINGPITTADAIAGNATANIYATYRSITLISGGLPGITRTIVVHPNYCYLPKGPGTYSFIPASSVAVGNVIAGYDPNYNTQGVYVVTNISNVTPTGFKGRFLTFRGDTAYKTIYLNDICVKCL